MLRAAAPALDARERPRTELRGDVRDGGDLPSVRPDEYPLVGLGRADEEPAAVRRPGETAQLTREAEQHTSDGISADGRRLVLASISSQPIPARTTFVVLHSGTLRTLRTIRLPGLWAFDAISPDGATIYALQYGAAADPAHYSVRAIDTISGRIFPGAIVDRREPDEEMRGSPVTRTWSADREWAFTLYSKPNGTAFVHGLDTTKRNAVCLDLPWRGIGKTIGQVRLRVSPDGQTLMLHQSGIGRLASVDLSNLVVRSFRPPVAPGVPAS